MSKKSLFMLLLIIIPVYQMVAESPFFAVKGKVKSYTKTEYVISHKFGDYFRTPNVLYTYKYIHLQAWALRCSFYDNGLCQSLLTAG